MFISNAVFIGGERWDFAMSAVLLHILMDVWVKAK